MKNLMKGSRCEKRISTDGLSAEEAFGPPAAIPFKWEEAPGKAKPREEGEMELPHIKQDGELYNQLICKADSMGHSSGSLYRSVDAGSIPFEWEAEPGKPKTPARDEGLVPLNPPPNLQSPDRIGSPFKGSASPVKASSASRRWASQNLMKWMFHNQRNKASGDSNSGTVKTHISVSQELGASKSSRISELPASFPRARSSHGRLEFTSKISSSSYSSETESARIGVSRRGSWWSLHTSNNKSKNLHNPNPNPTEHHISDEQNAANKGADLAQMSKDDNDEKSASEEEETLDFHHVIAEILNSEAAKEEMRSVITNGDKKEEVTVQKTTETNMELEIMMRFAQINVGKRKSMHAYKISDAAQPGGFFGCMPLCLFGPRRAKIYEDCMDSITSHCNAVSKSNHDLDRGF